MIRRKIVIETRSKTEQFMVASDIHHQLAGNKDYDEGRIVVSCNNEYDEVLVIIYDDCDRIPTIII